MKILVAQLRNQNPMEPLTNNEMASQLAQFSQLQQLETMNANFSKVLSTIQQSYANSLIGKEVTFQKSEDTEDQKIISGTVEQVYNNIDGETLLVIGNYLINLENVISVK